MKRGEFKQNYEVGVKNVKVAAEVTVVVATVVNCPVLMVLAASTIAKLGLDYVVDKADEYLATTEQTTPINAQYTSLSGDDFCIIDNTQ